MPRTKPDALYGLVTPLIETVSDGCAAGIAAGAALAIWHPALHALVASSSNVMLALTALLAVCMQTGAVLAIGLAMLPTQSEED